MEQASPMIETDSAAGSVRITRRFSAPPERVFDAWIQPDALKQWFGPGDVATPIAETDPRPGGRYVLEMRSPAGGIYRVEGEYLTVQRPERLVFTWFWKKGDTGDLTDHEMLVTIEIIAVDEGSELTLIHERIPTEQQAASHEGGWSSGLDNLGRYLSAA